jgi:hypothetical protein
MSMSDQNKAAQHPEGDGHEATTPANDPADLAATGGPLPGAPHDDPDDSPPDLESRRLCPDGACIGVIGADGRCKECGKEAEPLEAARADATPAPGSAPPAGPGAGEEAGSLDDPDDGGPPDLASRRLCSDGACIGVIGPDDRCKVCGRPYTGEPEL